MTFWDDNATREGVFNVGDMYDEYTQRQADFIIEQLDVGDDGLLVDLGCGIGRLTRPIAEAILGALVVGVDPSVEMRAAFLKTISDAHCVPGLDDVGYGDAFVHGAWSVLTFQHLPDDTVQQHLTDLFEILKPGARLVTQWVTHGEEGPMSYPRSWQQIHDLLRAAGFGLQWWAGDQMVTGYAPDWLWVVAEKPA